MKLEDYKFISWRSDAKPLWVSPIRLIPANKLLIIGGIEADARMAQHIIIRTGLTKTLSTYTDYRFNQEELNHFMFDEWKRSRLWDWLTGWSYLGY